MRWPGRSRYDDDVISRAPWFFSESESWRKNMYFIYRGYLTMSKILLRNGYKEHPEKYFSLVKQVQIDGILYDVDVDILAGMYGGTQKKKRSQHVQGVKALKATGGNFASEFDPQTVRIEAERIDGALDVARVNVIAVVPYFVMKTSAMGRGKAKDADDLYFLIKHYPSGANGLSKLFENYKDLKIILSLRKCTTLKEIMKIDTRAWFSTVTQARNFLEEQEYMAKIRIGFTILFKMTHLREHLKKKKVSLLWKGI